jgi:hypothetical protein
MKKFYAKTANTGLTSVVFCVMTWRGKPALFAHTESVKREIKDLYREYIKDGLSYDQSKVIGVTEAEKIIEKNNLTSYEGTK